MSTTRFYKRPTVFRRRVYDPLMRTLIQRVGFSGILDRRGRDTVQVLSVRGRRTGRLYEHPVGVSVHNGHRYLVGFYGQTEWALNLRAGCEAALSARGVTQPVRAIELAFSGDDKAANVGLRLTMSPRGLARLIEPMLSRVLRSDLSDAFARLPHAALRHADMRPPGDA